MNYTEKEERVKKKRNLTKLIQDRQLYNGSKVFSWKKPYVNDSFVTRLSLDSQLLGHKGCVNCLEWCDNGRYLLSGSDDTKAILWDPFRQKLLNIFDTNHVGNIFSIKKIENNNGPMLVTAAADARITVQSFDSVVYEPIFVCSCHSGRIKQLTTTPTEPHLFWSAAEDGLVLQFDLRESHNCQSKGTTALLDLFNVLYLHAEAKCIAINPLKPHLIAVGSNDPFVRVFDRRKLATYPYKNRLPMGEFGLITGHNFRDHVPVMYTENCAEYYVPLNRINDEYEYLLAITHITYNSTGNKLLANIGSDHIYSFDLTDSQNRLVKKYTIERYKNPEEFVQGKFFYEQLSDCSNCLQRIKIRLNNSVNTLKTPKVKELNDEIAKFPCYCKYFERGLALKKRNWTGDNFAALKDFLHVIPFYQNSKIILMKILELFISLNWLDIALQWNAYILKMFPNISRESEYNNKIQKLKKHEAQPRSYDVQTLLDYWKTNSQDYDKRYLGHCNIKTDIKEANFFGADNEFIVAGSDDGNIYFWNEKSTNIIYALNADSSILNIVQPHPYTCLLASSGIDPVIKLWRPCSDKSKGNQFEVKNLKHVIKRNQEKLSYDGVHDLDADICQYFMANEDTNHLCSPS